MLPESDNPFGKKFLVRLEQFGGSSDSRFTVRCCNSSPAAFIVAIRAFHREPEADQTAFRAALNQLTQREFKRIWIGSFAASRAGVSLEKLGLKKIGPFQTFTGGLDRFQHAPQHLKILEVDFQDDTLRQVINEYAHLNQDRFIASEQALALSMIYYDLSSVGEKPRIVTNAHGEALGAFSMCFSSREFELTKTVVPNFFFTERAQESGLVADVFGAGFSCMACRGFMNARFSIDSANDNLKVLCIRLGFSEVQGVPGQYILRVFQAHEPEP